MGASYWVLFSPVAAPVEPIARGVLVPPTPTPPPSETAPAPEEAGGQAGLPAGLLTQIPLSEPLVDIESRFVLPLVPTEAEFLATAHLVPPDQLPRTVRLRDALALALTVEGRSVGAIQLPSGTGVMLEKAEPGRLHIAHRNGRAVVAMNRTDFSDRVYRPHAERLQKERERIGQARAISQEKNQRIEESRAARATAIGPLPRQAPDGGYPEIAAALALEGGPQIPPADVTGWGTPRFLADQGSDYWAVDVEYRHSTPLGLIQDQRVALWQDGKFVRWVRGR